MILGVLFGFSSCVDTYFATKKATFDNANQSIQKQMSQKGFILTGKNSNAENEKIVGGVSYSGYYDYGVATKIDYVTRDNYSFMDSLGNTMNYSVSYRTGQTKEGESYVEDITVCGCETSDTNDYLELCGMESAVDQINKLPKDQKIVRPNSIKTIYAISGLGIGISLVITLVTLTKKY